jgi:hypothetical protein
MNPPGTKELTMVPIKRVHVESLPIRKMGPEEDV